jgi:flagellar protein FlaG
LPHAAAAPQASNEQLKKAVEEINRAMQQSGRNLQFSVDSATDRVVVRLTDTETGEVIRQIPSEETLEIARSIGQFQQGLLLKQQA